jgi:mxaA protein
MRIACLALGLIATLPASAQEPTVRVHSAQPFGYFVGDLIHARIDVSAPENAALSRASLPKPGPLTGSLDLRDVKFREVSENGARIWRLALTYQNFYVALDARDRCRVFFRFFGRFRKEVFFLDGWCFAQMDIFVEFAVVAA